MRRVSPSLAGFVSVCVAGILLAAAIALVPSKAHADELTLKDGTKISGTIVGFQDKSFRVKTNYGYAVVQKDQVVSINITTNAPDASGAAAASDKRPSSGAADSATPSKATKDAAATSAGAPPKLAPPDDPATAAQPRAATSAKLARANEPASAPTSVATKSAGANLPVLSIKVTTGMNGVAPTASTTAASRHSAAPSTSASSIGPTENSAAPATNKASIAATKNATPSPESAKSSVGETPESVAAKIEAEETSQLVKTETGVPTTRAHPGASATASMDNKSAGAATASKMSAAAETQPPSSAPTAAAAKPTAVARPDAVAKTANASASNASAAGMGAAGAASSTAAVLKPSAEPVREEVDGNTYTNDTFRFRMYKPPDWELIDGARKVLPGAIAAMGTDDDTTYLLIGQEGSAKSLTTAMDASERRLQEIMENFRPLGSERVNVGGSAAMEQRFRGTVDEHDWSGVVVLIPRGPRLYTIFGMTRADSDLVQIEENVIDRAISSLQFTP